MHARTRGYRRNAHATRGAGLERKSLVRPSRHEAYFLALLVGGKAVQYFNLGAVVKLRFMNELMQQDLRHLLTILLQVRLPPKPQPRLASSATYHFS
jgi:hypothetical protein